MPLNNPICLFTNPNIACVFYSFSVVFYFFLFAVVIVWCYSLWWLFFSCGLKWWGDEEECGSNCVRPLPSLGLVCRPKHYSCWLWTAVQERHGRRSSWARGEDGLERTTLEDWGGHRVVFQGPGALVDRSSLIPLLCWTVNFPLRHWTSIL